jgi:outer membrane protein assembly factor BamB
MKANRTTMASTPAPRSSLEIWLIGTRNVDGSAHQADRRGRMFAINKQTGEVVWERKIADPALGETLTLAPLVIRDLAIVGSAGGEFGIRGYIEATDLNTGKAAWRTYTIPGTGEPGNEAWKDGTEMQARITTSNTGPATTNGQRACSPSALTTARSNGASSTRRRTL